MTKRRKIRTATRASGPQPRAGVARETKRTVLTAAAYAAAELQAVKLDNIALRRQVLSKDKQLVSLQEVVLKKNSQILDLEAAALDADNKAIREEHGLRLGQPLHKDDETGEVYYVDSVEVEASAAEVNGGIIDKELASADSAAGTV